VEGDILVFQESINDGEITNIITIQRTFQRVSLASQIGDRFKIRFIAQIIGVISGGILTVALARLLEPDGYGLLFLSLSVFAIIKIFSRLGLAKSAARYIAEYKETDPGQVPHILQFSLLLSLGLITVVSVIFLATHRHIAGLIGEPELVPFLLIGVLFVVFGTLLTFVTKTLQGFEAIKATSVLTIINEGGRLPLALCFIVLGYGAVGALVGYIIATAIASTVGLIYLYIQFYRSQEPSEREPALRRRIAEYTIPITATSTANRLDKRIDTVLVGFFIGPTAVAFYTIGKQVIQFIETPMSALGFTLSPTYEAQKAKGNEATAARVYEEALSHGLLLYIPAAVGLILVAEPTIELVFGAQYLGAVPVLQVFGIYAVFSTVTHVTSNGLDFLGRARERAIIKGSTAILNVILNIILIPIIGVVGAAIATVITYGMYTFANVYIITLEFDLRINWLLRRLGATLAITLVMSIPVYLTVGFVTGFATLFGIVGLGVVIWGVLVTKTGLLDIRRVTSTLS